MTYSAIITDGGVQESASNGSIPAIEELERRARLKELTLDDSIPVIYPILILQKPPPLDIPLQRNSREYTHVGRAVACISLVAAVDPKTYLESLTSDQEKYLGHEMFDLCTSVDAWCTYLIYQCGVLEEGVRPTLEPQIVEGWIPTIDDAVRAVYYMHRIRPADGFESLEDFVPKNPSEWYRYTVLLARFWCRCAASPHLHHPVQLLYVTGSELQDHRQHCHFRQDTLLTFPVETTGAAMLNILKCLSDRGVEFQWAVSLSFMSLISEVFSEEAYKRYLIGNGYCYWMSRVLRRLTSGRAPLLLAHTPKISLAAFALGLHRTVALTVVDEFTLNGIQDALRGGFIQSVLAMEHILTLSARQDPSMVKISRDTRENLLRALGEVEGMLAWPSVRSLVLAQSSVTAKVERRLAVDCPDSPILEKWITLKERCQSINAHWNFWCQQRRRFCDHTHVRFLLYIMGNADLS